MKFLPAELKADPDSRARLLNEARAASLLRSPNIAVTYDIGESSGADFIVMEYVEGELLSSRVAKGPLAIREVVEIGLQVTDALDEAHARGIVHRDVKSANLMRTERGLVKVLDFGLAKFLRPEGAEAARVTQPQVTIAGMVVGTVSYMAPEQALGRPVDNRTDLFSLGVVLFELADRPHSVRRRLADRDHRSHPARDSAAALALRGVGSAVVRRRRRAGAREVADVPLSVRARHATGPARRRDRARHRAPRHDEPRRGGALPSAPPAIERSVAVMTFANITREPADDWIGTGIAETVSSDLKNIHGLTLIGRARVFDALRNLASGAHLDESLAIDIGRRLGATWVVVGGFQRLGELVRITANFVDVATGEVRRTVKVDGRIGEIFALQDKIVFELSQGLNLALRGTEIADIEKRETRSVEAYESYARGMMNLRLASRDSIERAISAFEDAIRHDQEYAMAWAALGGAYSLKGSFLSISDLVRKGVEMERRAVAIDPDLADAHMWLGTALLSLGQVDDAIASINEAIRLEPENGQALSGPWAARTGPGRAISPPRSRLSAAPSSSIPKPATPICSWGCCSRGKGKYEEAEAVCRRAVELQDQYISGNAGLQVVGANARLGYVFYLQGRYEEAHPRVRARPRVRRVERSRAQGTHQHRDHDEDRCRLPPHGKGRRGRALLRPRAQGVRCARGQGRRRSLHALLHRLPARVARRGRQRREGARHAGTRLRVAPAAHRRPRPPRSGPRQPARPAQVRSDRQRLRRPPLGCRDWPLICGYWSRSNVNAPTE